MKIAIFYHLPFGGAKRVVFEHTKGLKRLGHTVDVYSLDEEQDMFGPGNIVDKEFRYWYTPKDVSIPILSRIINDLQMFSTLKNLHQKIAADIDSRNYDIILVHTDTYTQAPYILRFLQTKNVYFCLEPLRIAYEYSLRAPDGLQPLNRLYEFVNRSVRKKIDRENARNADATLAISLFGREYMINTFDLYPKISYLGVDESEFRPLKIQKKNQVLFVAEKEYIYGYDLAEAAMKLLPKNQRPTLKVVFGTEKKQRISEQELVHLYNESLVTLSLSRFDTFGLVPLESMACATPVIALNVAGYRETILDSKTGFLTDFNPQEIADKILFLTQNPHLAEKMGQEGRNWIEKKWTWKIAIKQVEKILREETEK
jgi:glycosyltransferase involved in cell wall biosynthesis